MGNQKIKQIEKLNSEDKINTKKLDQEKENNLSNSANEVAAKSIVRTKSKIIAIGSFTLENRQILHGSKKESVQLNFSSVFEDSLTDNFTADDKKESDSMNISFPTMSQEFIDAHDRIMKNLKEIIQILNDPEPEKSVDWLLYLMAFSYPADVRDSAIGDMEEKYHLACKRHGKKEALNLLRSDLLRSYLPICHAICRNGLIKIFKLLGLYELFSRLWGLK